MLQRSSNGKAQVRRTNAKPRKLYPRERLSLQLKLRKLYRLLTGRVWNDYSITNDALGCMVLIYLRALGISDEIADRIAPWADISEIDKIAARIKLTRENAGEIIGRGIDLTWEDREKYRAWAFRPCVSPEDFDRLNADKRNKKKRDERAAQASQRTAQIKAMSRPAHEMAVYATVERLSRRRPGWCGIPITVRRIRDGIPYKYGHLFSLCKDVMRVIRRDLDRLERDGLVQTQRSWENRGERIIWLADGSNAVAPTVPPTTVPKPWEIDGVSRATHFRHRKQKSHRGRETNPDTRTAHSLTDISPQVIDEAALSPLASLENETAHLYRDETLSKTTNTEDGGTIRQDQTEVGMPATTERNHHQQSHLTEQTFEHDGMMKPVTVCVDDMAQAVKAGKTVVLHGPASSNRQRERARLEFQLRRLRRQLAEPDRRQVYGTDITTTKQTGASGK